LLAIVSDATHTIEKDGALGRGECWSLMAAKQGHTIPFGGRVGTLHPEPTKLPNLIKTEPSPPSLLASFRSGQAWKVRSKSGLGYGARATGQVQLLLWTPDQKDGQL
jgi:hypothetical protein